MGHDIIPVGERVAITGDMNAGERGTVEAYITRLTSPDVYRIRHEWGTRAYYFWKVHRVSPLEQLAEAAVG